MKNKRIKSYNATPTSGFTLLEALISITILMLAIGGAFGVAPEGLSAARYARNQITASYLAQEAIEVVRNKRDNCMLYSTASAPCFNDWLKEVDNSGCLTPNTKCVVDGVTLDPTKQLTPKTSPLPRVKYIPDSVNPNIGVYGNGSDFDQNPDAVDTIFTRWVEIRRVTYDQPSDPSPDDALNREVEVKVTVSWNEATKPRKIEATENLLNWWQQ